MNASMDDDKTAGIKGDEPSDASIVDGQAPVEPNADPALRLTDLEAVEPAPVAVESGEALIETVPPAEEPTVGTGSYIGVSCAIAMLILTIILIGVVFLLRWIG